MSLYRDYSIRDIALADGMEGKVSEVSAEAAKKVLADTQKENIRVLILVTQEEDFLFPATAFVIHKELELPQYCMVYDINLGADGFLTALETAIGLLIPYGKEAEALVIAGDCNRASAARIGSTPGMKIEFVHKSNPRDWDIAYRSRWSKELEFDRERYKKVIDVSVPEFEEQTRQRDITCLICPQKNMAAEELSDSPVLVPKEIIQKKYSDDWDSECFACFGCGAGGSITAAYFTV
ncbi:MAG: hypothetical protein J1F02_05065 [Lachnospiraceae bacterium]|nr:hypothetical protein [Lachnospiraceae bacterium]